MRIVYLIRDCNGAGGMERVLCVKANYLVNHGYDIHIICSEKIDDDVFFDFDPRIYFYSLGLDKDRDKKKYKQVYIDRLSERLYAIKPDITISMGVALTVYAPEVNDGSIKIIERHFSKYKRDFYLAKLDKYYLGRKLVDLIVRKQTSQVARFDKVVLLTEEDKSHWRSISDIRVIPNPNTFSNAPYSNNESKKVIAVGHFNYAKGFDSLISIWRYINIKYPDWSLTIYGDGPKKEEVQEYVDKLGLTKSVKLEESTTDIVSKYRESSILTITSRYEAWSLVLTEGMSCGLPAVAFACKCGPRDIISDNVDGFLISPNDIDTYVTKLSQLIEDDELRSRMSESARENIQRFNIDNVMPIWMNLFDELYKNKSSK